MASILLSFLPIVQSFAPRRKTITLSSGAALTCASSSLRAPFVPAKSGPKPSLPLFFCVFNCFVNYCPHVFTAAT
ncbi:hypothetical protein BOTBODRAFT_591715 [Botryobasidium botryosum FD-172 SS1]|uniref:Uncharacterized protein n=1 Tax=Botryobasidium botryosum (strain FD-172 SS1) TaxID=930990 RepID=A0A067LX75_BOTB1|nr:hypothetical protein BOTBODRAFT_591715 [Botryobasidium botryosum FD-172 SS1]